MSMRGAPRFSLRSFQNAARAGELFLMYQPKLDLRSGRIIGVEALARWQNPRWGAVDPSIFIPAAESAGLMDWFTEWALGTAIAQWAAWTAEGIHLDLAVNISALNLHDVRFPDLVCRLCDGERVDRAGLTLELTESASQEATRLMDTISRFRLKGIGIALDDFGTGFGSLVQLRTLPFTELKIDRSFVGDLTSSGDSSAITRALIAMARELGLKTTGEGVEDAATLDSLTRLGCDLAQGFHIARAMPGDQLPLWIGRWDGERVFGSSLPSPAAAAPGSSRPNGSPREAADGRRAGASLACLEAVGDQVRAGASGLAASAVKGAGRARR